MSMNRKKRGNRELHAALFLIIDVISDGTSERDE